MCKINIFIYLFKTFKYLFNFWQCWVFIAHRFFSSCGEQGLFCSCSAWTSHCGGFSCCIAWALGHVGSGVVAPRLWGTASVVVAHELSCSKACGIFLNQGSNPCPLHWQVGSYPLCPQRSASSFSISNPIECHSQRQVWGLWDRVC